MAKTDTALQRRWLDSALARSTAKWKFIVGHDNVYSGGKRPVLEDLERFLIPRMKRHNVTAYLCGHEHQLEHIAPGGQAPDYLISGAPSETRPAAGKDGTRFVSSRSGFLARRSRPIRCWFRLLITPDNCCTGRRSRRDRNDGG